MDDLNDDALPCPLCGRAPRVWSHEQYYLHCSDNREASIEGPLRPSLAEAVAAWNAMPVHTAMALLRAVERLETALRCETDAVGLYRNGWRIRGTYNWPRGPVADTDCAADAIIALAAQLEDRDA